MRLFTDVLIDALLNKRKTSLTWIPGENMMPKECCLCGSLSVHRMKSCGNCGSVFADKETLDADRKKQNFEKQKPLSENQIKEIFGKLWFDSETNWLKFARAVEEAHGIKELKP